MSDDDDDEYDARRAELSEWRRWFVEARIERRALKAELKKSGDEVRRLTVELGSVRSIYIKDREVLRVALDDAREGAANVEAKLVAADAQNTELKAALKSLGARKVRR